MVYLDHHKFYLNMYLNRLKYILELVFYKKHSSASELRFRTVEAAAAFSRTWRRLEALGGARLIHEGRRQRPCC